VGNYIPGLGMQLRCCPVEAVQLTSPSALLFMPKTLTASSLVYVHFRQGNVSAPLELKSRKIMQVMPVYYTDQAGRYMDEQIGR
jgi:hypothetical protein